MIRHDKHNRIVYLIQKSGMEIGITERDYRFLTITAISEAIQNNKVKILINDKWGYWLEHYTQHYMR